MEIAAGQAADEHTGAGALRSAAVPGMFEGLHRAFQQQAVLRIGDLGFTGGEAEVVGVESGDIVHCRGDAHIVRCRDPVGGFTGGEQLLLVQLGHRGARTGDDLPELVQVGGARYPSGHADHREGPTVILVAAVRRLDRLHRTGQCRRQRGHGRISEQIGPRDRNRQFLFQGEMDLCDQQRIAAQIEEIRVGGHRVAVEHPRPDAGDGDRQRVRLRGDRGNGPGRIHRLRQPSAIDLARGGARKLRQHHISRRNHIGR